MAKIPDPKKHLEDGQRKRLPKDTQIIKTRNSSQSTYVRQFQKLSPDHNLKVESDLFKRLDLATAFKGLTIVTFTDANLEDTPSTSNQQPYRPFHYPSPSPSPTTTEEIEDIPELVENQDLPLPDEVLDDNIPIEDSDWSPPSVAFLPWLVKRKQNSSSPDTGECWRCKQLKRKSWPGCNVQGEQ